ncbi:unnamed protein product [Rhizophagus irregularis]|uniref:Uncharacterized protein n=1 Tax=Rhizophagus irregularis TaxID=588596 RepID=A0A915YXT4_9GLOM|nr:unnamed protein product [Rhizophagus irregularis]
MREREIFGTRLFEIRLLKGRTGLLKEQQKYQLLGTEHLKGQVRYQFLPLGLGFCKFQGETYVSVGSTVDLRSGIVGSAVDLRSDIGSFSRIWVGIGRNLALLGFWTFERVGKRIKKHF